VTGPAWLFASGVALMSLPFVALVVRRRLEMRGNALRAKRHAAELDAKRDSVRRFGAACLCRFRRSIHDL
jgi:hypothetical protein